MKARPGFALPLVLGIIVILVAICASVAVGTRRTTNAAVAYRDLVSARYAAESGITNYVANRATHVDLHDASADVDVVDVGTLLDVNMASEEGLVRLFSYFTSEREAEIATRALRERMRARPLRSLAELRAVTAVPRAALHLLTIDGDGNINNRAVSDTVRNAAGGSLTDRPTRLMLISHGHAGAREVEITAVYAIQNEQLVFMRWEEAHT